MKSLKNLHIFILALVFIFSSFVNVSFAASGDGRISRTVEIDDSTTNGPVLSDSDGWGTAIANIGDLNNDGVDDLVVGARNDDGVGSDQGAVHILFMNRDGSVSSTVEINGSTTNGPTLSNSDYFGSGVAGLGDLDGDGVEDIVVGAYGDDNGGSGRGAIHILFLDTDGSVKSTVEINDSTTNGPVLADGDSFGWFQIANIGDLNDDGVIDIAVGASNDSGSDDDRGAIHILFLNTDGSVDSTVEINDTTPNGPALQAYTYMAAVAGIGDLNGDDVEDLLIGSPGGYTGAYNYGAAHILFMNTDGSVDSTVRIDHTTTNGPQLASGQRHYNDWFGVSVANVGDVDGDGVTDIAVGAHIDDGAGADRGAVYLFYLNTNASLKGYTRIDSSNTNGPNISNFEQFGFGVSYIGDFDRNGVPDIVVGASSDYTAGLYRGSIHIMFLDVTSSGIAKTIAKPKEPTIEVSTKGQQTIEVESKYPGGNIQINEYGFTYNEEDKENKTETINMFKSPFYGNASFNYILNDLKCNTTYEFKAYAKNSIGTTYSDEVKATTSKCTNKSTNINSVDSVDDTTTTNVEENEELIKQLQAQIESLMQQILEILLQKIYGHVGN